MENLESVFGKESENVFARFHDVWKKTGNVKENGLPEFVQKTYVEIRIKGSTDKADRPINEMDIKRFPNEYAAYQIKKERIENGTPLTMFAFLNAAEIEVCELKGIVTVEDLSQLTDAQAQEMNILEARDQALKFLEMSKNNASIAKFEEENKKLKEQISKLKDEIKALKEK